MSTTGMNLTTAAVLISTRGHRNGSTWIFGMILRCSTQLWMSVWVCDFLSKIQLKCRFRNERNKKSVYCKRFSVHRSTVFSASPNYFIHFQYIRTWLQADFPYFVDISISFGGAQTEFGSSACGTQLKRKHVFPSFNWFIQTNIRFRHHIRSHRVVSIALAHRFIMWILRAWRNCVSFRMALSIQSIAAAACVCFCQSNSTSRLLFVAIKFAFMLVSHRNLQILSLCNVSAMDGWFFFLLFELHLIFLKSSF